MARRREQRLRRKARAQLRELQRRCHADKQAARKERLNALGSA